MELSIHLTPEEAALVAQAARSVRVTTAEFMRRSVISAAHHALRQRAANESADAHWIGHGGGLRDPATITNPLRRRVLERLRER